MEELYNDIQRWMKEQIKIKQEEEIKRLADILVEGFMWQLEGKTEESMEEVRDKKQKKDPQSFYY